MRTSPKFSSWGGAPDRPQGAPLAEVLVVVRLAFRQLRRTELDVAVGAEAELVPVQVVAWLDLPAHGQLVSRVEAGVHDERFVGG
jgi:hypothetical protein